MKPSKTSWNYTELPSGMYSASLSGEEGRWLFRAHPNRGDWCIELIEADLSVMEAKIESFLAGEPNIAGMYSASF